MSEPTGPTTPQWVLIGIGSIVVIRFILSIAHVVNKFVFRQAPNFRHYGEWAVITGSTDGIGKAYAFELAKRKIKLVLISRTQSRLDATKKEIEAKHGVEVRTIAADLSSPDPSGVTSIGEQLDELDVGILINNAGMSHDHPEFLEAIPQEHLLDLLNLNVTSLTLLTRAVVGGMKRRRRGLIINLSSGAAELPTCPLLTVYTASKAYVDSFSDSLAEEVKSFGVAVEAPAALFVATKMSKVKKPRRDVPSPEVWVNAALRQAGRNQHGFPYYYHAYLGKLLSSFPSALSRSVILKTNLKTRAAYYRKLARAQRAAEDEGKKDS